MIPERLVPGTLSWTLYEVEHKQRYNFFAHHARGCHALDVACGVGYGTHILAEEGAASVTGVDISDDAVQFARVHFAHPRIQYVQGNAEHLPLNDDLFDVVFSFETIEHVPNPSHFIKEVHRVLRPGGIFICSTPNAEYGKGSVLHVNPYHLSEMTLDEMRSVFAPDFDIEDEYYQSHSDAYLRWVDLLSEIDRKVVRPLRFSRLLRLENQLRRLSGSDPIDAVQLSVQLPRAVSGDFVIERLKHPSSRQLTLIVVARAT